MRTYLGSDIDAGGRRKVFRIEDALEVEDAAYLRIERTRVYFDDILAVTQHRFLGIGYLVMLVLFGGLFCLPGFIVVATDGNVGGWVAIIIMGTPFVLAFILRIILRVDAITVHGRRSSARMCYSFRKARAREVYRDLVLRITEAQRKLAPPPPPPAAEQPPSPPPPESPPAS